MKISINDIKSLIKNMGFKPQNGTNEVYFKEYTNHNNYIIRINFNTNKIEYRSNDIDENNGIGWGDATTSNFENSENFVVLECINRLLEKGYAPQNLYLEYKFPLGRDLKGKLDILVFDNDKKAYLMIECKTWGTEFEKEQNKMQKNGGQLFSYFVQDKGTKYLCLYTSTFIDDSIEYKNDVIKVDEVWSELNNQKEIHDHWNKNVKDNGIFEEWANAYDVEIKALVRGRLQPLTKDDSGRIFNQFAEILRHNVVSDKPNAFNKILNLFICKIIDEDKNDSEQVEFQWLEDDTNEILQLRLNDLYKKGMQRFLDIDVTDFTESEISNTLVNIDDSQAQKAIRDMFIKLRLQKNPEFAFIEVYDESSFKRNARVVKEVVELLQPYQFRYGHKQQFLGDFFELLLNTSMKQEAGQYFTPVPITRYIISSLPIKEFIENKMKTDNIILPTVIDFACGTGHFLTEYMDKVQTIIENEIDSKKAKPTARKKLNIWSGENGKFEWASDFVYGIDADYRLVKSSKVSSFLNGDGEANIIRANGLDHFTKSTEYRGKLKQSLNEDNQDNGQFDILIANPPYSVNSFKSTVKWGEESFELFEKLTDNSSEIECLFIERMKQLLKVDGYAGIILPSSILSNTGIYTATREIILKYFKIIAITEFGSNTFMATGTNTVTLFLQRRPNTDHKHIKNAVESFFEKPKDVTVLGTEKAFSKFVSNVYDEISLDDYISFISKKPNDNFKNLDIYKDYRSWFNGLTEIKHLKTKKIFTTLSTKEQSEKLENLFYEKVFEKEKDKLLYFILIYNQKTVITKVGEKQAEKDFIGYEFSNRRGHEGIKMLPNGTKLYDEDDSLNPNKANSYIHNAFMGKYDNIEESIADNIKYLNTINLIDFSSVTFEKNININSKKKLNYSEIWENANLVTLNTICKIEKGTSITKKQVVNGDVPVVAGGKNIAYYHNISNRSSDIITVSASGANAGFISYWNIPIYASDCTSIKSLDDTYLDKYIYYCLVYMQNYIYYLQKGQAQPHVYRSDLAKLKIPKLKTSIQQKIVDEISVIENNGESANNKIEQNKLKISEILYRCFSNLYKMEKLGNIAEIYNGATPSTAELDNWNGTINWVTLVDTKVKYILSTKRRITEKGLSRCNAKMLPINTVLFSSRATIGEVSIAKTELCTNQGYKNFVCDKSKLNYEYLYYILKHEAKNIEKLASGMTYAEISKSMIQDFKIPLPPLSKQEKIVDEIQKLEIEINTLDQEIAQAESKKKAILVKYLL